MIEFTQDEAKHLTEFSRESSFALSTAITATFARLEKTWLEVAVPTCLRGQVLQSNILNSEQAYG